MMPPRVIPVSFSADKSFEITVGRGIIPDLPDLIDLGRYSRAVIVGDENTLKLFEGGLRAALAAAGLPVHILSLAAGEASKSLAEVERSYRFLLEHGVDRDGLLCALGGGVTGDVTGFVAATYLRGVDFIQIPTTLLAQVDSAIGGKTGVNLAEKKNVIGSFYQPRAIVADTALLEALPTEEMRSGGAEVVKYGLALDAELFNLIRDREKGEFSAAELPEIVARCAALKAEVISRDETDRTGVRAILNFGHTVGHAVEAATRLRTLRHGEAVSLGMVAATTVSARLGMVGGETVETVRTVLRRFGLPVACPELVPDSIEAALQYDKKVSAGEIKWVLLEGIGRGVTGREVDPLIVRDVLEEVCR